MQKNYVKPILWDDNLTDIELEGAVIQILTLINQEVWWGNYTIHCSTLESDPMLRVPVVWHGVERVVTIKTGNGSCYDFTVKLDNKSIQISKDQGRGRIQVIVHDNLPTSVRCFRTGTDVILAIVNALRGILFELDEIRTGGQDPIGCPRIFGRLQLGDKFSPGIKPVSDADAVAVVEPEEVVGDGTYQDMDLEEVYTKHMQEFDAELRRILGTKSETGEGTTYDDLSQKLFSNFPDVATEDVVDIALYILQHYRLIPVQEQKDEDDTVHTQS